MNLTAATVFALVVLRCVECKRCSDNPVVYTSYGKVRGSYNASRHGRMFMSFRGIPYAQPPIGQLRFKVKLSHSYSEWLGSVAFAGATTD